jgi:hypothetical protein
MKQNYRTPTQIQQHVTNFVPFVKKWVVGFVASVFLAQPFFASVAMAADQASCEAKALSKDGKPLAGAAKAASIKKCLGDGKPSAAASCEAKAVSKEGKKLAGAAKASFMKKCEAQAAS